MRKPKRKPNRMNPTTPRLMMNGRIEFYAVTAIVSALSDPTANARNAGNHWNDLRMTNGECRIVDFTSLRQFIKIKRVPYANTVINRYSGKRMVNSAPP